METPDAAAAATAASGHDVSDRRREKRKAPPASSKGSQSREWQNLLQGNASLKKRTKGQKLAAHIQKEREENEGQDEGYVPPAMRGSGLEIVQRQSKRKAEVDEAAKDRRRSKKARASEIRPEHKSDSPVWVFFREAKEDENKRFIYCVAYEYRSQRKCTEGRVKISVGKDGKQSLKASNAESHLVHCHPEWWEVVKDAASKGKSAKNALAALQNADSPLPRQSQISGFGRSKLRPGKLSKEVALVAWLIRKNIAFNSVDDDKTFAPLKDTLDIQVRGSEGLKSLVFPMYEVAIRQAAEKIVAAGAYSITIDYWTASNGQKYLSITYHWTDANWRVQSQTLDLVPVKNASATGSLTQQLISIRTEDHFEPRPRWSEAVRSGF
jgi:hypothetical protein